MNPFKKLTVVATAAALIGFSMPQLDAYEYYASNLGGFGYEESRDAPSMFPAIILGTVALGAIIAVALQDSHHGHGLSGH